MKHIGVTGGTGLVGRHLCKLLAESGYELIVFTRNPNKKRKYIKNTQYAKWDPIKNIIDTEQLGKVEALVHLSGEGVADKRWTEQRKTDIIDSRVISTTFIVQALKEHNPNCKVFISASATGYYGANNGTEPFSEDAIPANDFLGRTCVKWEQSSDAASEFTRRVVLRLGIVLAKEGGAFKEFYKPMKMGVTPVLGSGEQMVSWIHVLDVARMIRFAIQRIEVTGVYNAVAPLPVSHSVLVHTMARVKGGLRIPIPVPSFALKLIMGEMSIEVLKSCTVSADKIQNRGFKFEHRDIESAVADLLKKKER